MSGASRVYGWLLRAYPAHWRARFAAGMQAAFAADLERVRARGFVARIAFWLTTVVQALWFGVSERMLGGMSLRSFIAVDWRAAMRALRGAPVITAMAVASLALGIGANTALFSILNGLLLKPLPVYEPERLALFEDDTITNPIWEQLKHREDQLMGGLAAWSTEPFDLSTGGRTDIVTGAWVSGRLFDVLGLKTIRGRPLVEADDQRGGGATGPVAVITAAFWRARFGAAPDIVGRPITIQHVPFTIVGVADPAFTALDIGTELSVLVPIATEAAMRGVESHLDGRSDWWLHVIGRLKPGQSLDEATAAVRAVQPQIRTATIPLHWNDRDKAVFLSLPFKWTPAATGRSPLRAQYRRPLATILAVVGAVLLIACANIASLLLSRAQARRRELSVRLALGASRGRLARQLFVESLILATAGAALGLLVASWGGALLVQQISTYNDAVALDLSIDWRVLAFTSGIAFLTALLFGAAPALSVSRVEPIEMLKEQSRAVIGERRFGARQALIVLQVALSLALVVAAGLFVRSFVAIVRVPLGFNPAPLTVVDVVLPARIVDPMARVDLYERLRAAAAAVPGVVRASSSALTPASDNGWNASVDVSDGLPLPERRRLDWINAISPEWFETYGMRLRAGRALTAQDRRGAPNVAIVNESFVRRRFGEGVNAIGHTVAGDIEVPSKRMSFEIVGVVSDAIYRTQRSGPESTIYLPIAQLQAPTTELSLTVQTPAGLTEPLTRLLAEALERVEPGAGTTFRSYREQIQATMTRERLVAMLSGFFGALALVMVSLGLYGVTVYWISRRRAEIGIRIALGAHRASVVRLVLRQISWLIVIGIAAGAALSLWAVKFAGTLLFGLEPRDPVTFVGASLLLLLVGLAAGWLPARRAASVDRLTALREQ